MAEAPAAGEPADEPFLASAPCTAGAPPPRISFEPGQGEFEYEVLPSFPTHLWMPCASAPLQTAIMAMPRRKRMNPPFAVVPAALSGDLGFTLRRLRRRASMDLQIIEARYWLHIQHLCDTMVYLHSRDVLYMQLPLLHRDPPSAIAEFEQILASNSGEDPFDSAIKLLAAKLIDESGRDPNEPSNFKIQKSPDATHRTVQSLYRKAVQRWPQLNGTGADLDISPQHLVRSMRPLLGWRLSDSDLSWLDATLERLVAKDSKGALGQYFTPRDIVRLCIEVLNPSSKDTFIDPACGSGGFIFEATRHSLRNSGGAPKCLGLDFGARAIKVATLLAAATSNARIAISKANSIDGRLYTQDSPSEWEEFTARNAGARTKRAESWGAWNKLGCTVLATNPPFAGDIDEVDILDAYESQSAKTGRSAVSREHLFLERAVQMLRPKGRLAIVLPQGLLSNPSASYLRSWLFRRCRILGVIGLHPHAFLPYTSVKTALLFAEKIAPNEELPPDYQVFFATSGDCGKDSRGKLTDTADYSDLSASFRTFLRSQNVAWAHGPKIVKSDAVRSEAISFREITKADRLDAEYYDPDTRELLRKFDSKSVAQIGSFVDSKPDRFKRALFHNVQYLDISCVEAKTGLALPNVIPASDAPSRASYLVRQGDVLVSTVRPDRNVVALVDESGGVPIVASNGFCVLRPTNIEPEVLFAYCKTESFRQMLSRHATASMYPTITDKDVLGMPFIPPSAEISDRVKKLVQSGQEMLKKGQQQLNDAIALMTNHIQEPYQIQNKTKADTPLAQQARKEYHAKKRKR